MRRPSGNDLLIATSLSGGEPLMLTKEQRSRHLYVTGSTGSGKSKFLEHLIRQDIMNWRESECGLLLLDPHGAIYDGLMHWLTRNSHIYKRPVIPIDLRRDDWVVAYNLLRERERVAPSVVTDNLVDALAYVWGASGTDQTPLLARIATTIFQALYEHKLTLVEALKILEFANHEFRGDPRPRHQGRARRNKRPFSSKGTVLTDRPGNCQSRESRSRIEEFSGHSSG
jgi:hypothetical protein